MTETTAATGQSENSMEIIKTRACDKCGIMVEQPSRGHRKYCEACRKDIQDQRSRECHAKRREGRANVGMCTQCGADKSKDVLDLPLADFLSNIDPRLVDVITLEQIQNAKMCSRCYAIYRLRLLEMRLSRPQRPKPPSMTEEQRKERMKILGQQRRERIIAENPGICHHCLKRPQEEGKLWCTFCLDRGVAANRRKIEKRRQAAKCVICEKPTGGQQLCEKCKKTQKKYSKKWWSRIKQERIEQGICLRCGLEPVVEGKKSCETCAEKAREYTINKRRADVCPRCKQEPIEDGRAMCKECNEKVEKVKQQGN